MCISIKFQGDTDAGRTEPPFQNNWTKTFLLHGCILYQQHLLEIYQKQKGSGPTSTVSKCIYCIEIYCSPTVSKSAFLQDSQMVL